MEINTTYEPFSDRPEYKKVNHDFLAKILKCEDIGNNVIRVLDLACGTGTLDEILLDITPSAKIIGVDISKESLDIGRDRFRSKDILSTSSMEVLESVDDHAKIFFIEDSADNLNFEPETFDIVMMGNSIHMLPDKEKLLEAIARVLKKDGLFLFNTAFFSGTYPPGTEYVYTEWIKCALLYIQQVSLSTDKLGQVNYKRSRVKGNKAFDKGWMSPDEWSSLLWTKGFEPIHLATREMDWSQETFETVGSYSGFAEVMMSGYPVDIACESLQIGARDAFRNLNIKKIPRLWLEVASRKK